MQKAVAVHDDDTAESLQQRVMIEAEQVILPQAIQLIADGMIHVEGKKTKIINRTEKK